MVNVLSLAMPNRFYFDGQDWEAFKRRILIEFENIMEEEHADLDLVQDAIVQTAFGFLQSDIDDDNAGKTKEGQMEMFETIKNPFVRLIAARVTHTRELALSVVPFEEKLSDNPTWHKLMP